MDGFQLNTVVVQPANIPPPVQPQVAQVADNPADPWQVLAARITACVTGASGVGGGIFLGVVAAGKVSLDPATLGLTISITAIALVVTYLLWDYANVKSIAHQVDRFRAQNNVLIENNKAFGAQNTQYHELLLQNHRQLQESAGQVQQRNTQIQQGQQQLTILSQANATLQTQVAESATQIERRDAQIQQGQVQLETLTRTNTELQSQVEQSRGQIAQREEQLHQSREQLQQNAEQLQRHGEQIVALQTVESNLRDRVTQYEAQLNEGRAQIEERNRQLELSQREVEGLTRVRNDLETSQAALQEQIDRHQTLLQENQEQIAQLEGLNQALNASTVMLAKGEKAAGEMLKAQEDLFRREQKLQLEREELFQKEQELVTRQEQETRLLVDVQGRLTASEDRLKKLIDELAATKGKLVAAKLTNAGVTWEQMKGAILQRAQKRRDSLAQPAVNA